MFVGIRQQKNSFFKNTKYISRSTLKTKIKKKGYVFRMNSIQLNDKLNDPVGWSVWLY